MRHPGFISAYLNDVEQLQPAVRALVNSPRGLNEKLLRDLLLNPPHLATVFSPPLDHVVGYHQDNLEHYAELGSSAIMAKTVAYCIVAGSRDASTDEPSAFVEVPQTGTHLLGLKLQQALGEGPIWIMVSPDVHDDVKRYIANQDHVNPDRITVFDQFMSYRLTPTNGIVFDAEGATALYPCGAGDLFPALSQRNFLKAFLQSGGRYVFVTDVQNVFGTLDPSIIGYHIETSSKVTCEVVKRKPLEDGSVLAEASTGLSLVALSTLNSTDHEQYTWLATSSFVMNADLDYSRLGNAWTRVLRNVGQKAYVQHERSLDEITSAYDTTYLGVSRAERFMPLRSSVDRDVVTGIVAGVDT